MFPLHVLLVSSKNFLYPATISFSAGSIGQFSLQYPNSDHEKGVAVAHQYFESSFFVHAWYVFSLYLNGKRHGVFSLLPWPDIVLHCVGLGLAVVSSSQALHDFLQFFRTSKSLHPNLGIENEVHFFHSFTQNEVAFNGDEEDVSSSAARSSDLAPDIDWKTQQTNYCKKSSL